MILLDWARKGGPSTSGCGASLPRCMHQRATEAGADASMPCLLAPQEWARLWLSQDGSRAVATVLDGSSTIKLPRITNNTGGNW